MEPMARAANWGRAWTLEGSKVIIALIWLGLCVAIGLFANSRGRDTLDWFLIGFLFSPFLAFVFLVVLPSEPASFEAEAIYKGTPYRKHERWAA